MKDQEAMEIFDLIIRDNRLPAELDKLIPLSFIGQKAVTFYREKIQLMNQLGIAEEQKRATLADGQDAGCMLLEIETKIGQLIFSLPRSQQYQNNQEGGKKPRKGELSKVGFVGDSGYKRAHQARQIASHPEAVAEVIKEAEENEDIPTKTAVLKHIRLKESETVKEIPNINKALFDLIAKLFSHTTRLEEILKFKDQVSEINLQSLRLWRDKINSILEEI